MKWFVVQDVTVFGHVFKVLYIGGNHQDALPEIEFCALVESFPFSGTELRHYADSRIEAALASYFDTPEDFQGRYQDYMEGKAARRYRIAAFPGERGFGRVFNETRCAMYEDAPGRLVALVEGNAYERRFQEVLPYYLELLFPQYIAFVGQALIPDFDGGLRKPDYLTVDARGNVDVLEIKRPFDNDVMLAEGRYRNNCIPGRVLSGAVMQCQKYIVYLQNGGARLGKRLTEKLVGDYPALDGLRLRFTSPKGLVIMGRDPVGDRLRDFDLIRRQYADVVDVITYDDLIARFRRIAESARSKVDDESGSV